MAVEIPRNIAAYTLAALMWSCIPNFKEVQNIAKYLFFFMLRWILLWYPCRLCWHRSISSIHLHVKYVINHSHVWLTKHEATGYKFLCGSGYVQCSIAARVRRSLLHLLEGSGWNLQKVSGGIANHFQHWKRFVKCGKIPSLQAHTYSINSHVYKASAFYELG